MDWLKVQSNLWALNNRPCAVQLICDIHHDKLPCVEKHSVAFSVFRTRCVQNVLNCGISKLTLPSLPSHCHPSEGCKDTTSAPENTAGRYWWSGTRTGRWGWAGPSGSKAGGPLRGVERHSGGGGRSKRRLEVQPICLWLQEEQQQTFWLSYRVLRSKSPSTSVRESALWIPRHHTPPRP